ncbi:uncharacterized protein Z519_12318 [Cladophialophora bantiana CBS 173.52]|uniref:Heterokaryon incompatibility domain-containing protein n=1 Tax=Cladophialophora bantiana (strain ATCC 10958 / CBS 173.52 / CDC B-1940 / NIH 8579) TaxID=1442370 RepID=A0A0D2EAC1_CLAB1|nr:uncharacterized protein Z519_12318 [Cladophialophora bantiana CBS 173.52]KIW87021.1 hypothetical protein Z519_12318 [Cladophialophora bantiana CBS 173.52]
MDLTRPGSISRTNDRMEAAVDRPVVPLDIRMKVYHPIKPWQTRLLRIHSSKDRSSPVTCDLLTVDLIPFAGIGLVDESEIVQYEALSYSWGYPKFTHAIICNGIRFPVSETLHEALRHLRKPDKFRYLWCDACCIDQANKKEKARQVEIMFTIFEKARHVVAWLGTPTVEDEFLFDYISRTEGQQQRPSKDDDVQRVSNMFENRLRMSNSAGVKDEGSDSDFTRAKNAALTFITKPFFERQWIRQEYEAAEELSLVCGNCQTAISTFLRALQTLLSDYGASYEVVLSEPELISRAWLRYTYFRSHFLSESLINTSQNWFSTVMRGSVYAATLPHDKIFSILGIAARFQKDKTNLTSHVGRKPWNITLGYPGIDYHKSVSLVFQDFIKFTINLEKTLACLAIVQDRSTIGPDLPSWAIDLRVDVPRCQLFSSGIRGCKAQDFNNHGTLVVLGQKVGRIGVPKSQKKDICPFADDYPHQEEQNRALVDQPSLKDCLTQSESDLRMIPDSFPKVSRLIQRRCNYTYKEITMDTPVNFSRSQWCAWLFGRQRYTYALASSLVDDGDWLVLLQGSRCLFVLRQNSDNRYTFLGPAICYIGTYSPGWPEQEVKPEMKKSGDSKRWRSLPTFTYTWFFSSHIPADDSSDEEFVLV